MNGLNSRMALVGLTAFVAAAVIVAALFEAMFLTDFTSVVVIGGFVAGIVLVAATVLLFSSPRLGGEVAALGGLLAILLGVAEIATTGLIYEAPAATQPAWIQEVFDIVAGAVIIAVSLRFWMAGAPSTKRLGTPL